MLYALILAAEGGQIDWTTALIGYGPLGLFAIGVIMDKVGPHGERDRLRAQLDEKDKHIQDLHSKMEGDVLPALLTSATVTAEGTKALAEAIDIIREYSDAPARNLVTRNKKGG